MLIIILKHGLYFKPLQKFQALRTRVISNNITSPHWLVATWQVHW
jgi:hypothetical protein